MNDNSSKKINNNVTCKKCKKNKPPRWLLVTDANLWCVCKERILYNGKA